MTHTWVHHKMAAYNYFVSKHDASLDHISVFLILIEAVTFVL